jgi:hypothetical protein
MPLTKLKHWDTRPFHTFLLARATAPFVWGENDCCLFAADGIEAIMGTDIAADFRGKYHDQFLAFETIKAVIGGTSVEDAAAYCAAEAGLTELQHPLTAQRRDLVLLTDAGGLIHLSGRQAVSVGESGLNRLPLSAIKRAWRVG